MNVGTDSDNEEKNRLRETNHAKRLQRIIAVLFFMALLSLGAFILLLLLLDRTPWRRMSIGEVNWTDESPGRTSFGTS